MRKFCSLVLGWCQKHIDPEKWDEWMFQMDAPLPGEKPTAKATDAELEADREAFLAAQRQFG